MPRRTGNRGKKKEQDDFGKLEQELARKSKHKSSSSPSSTSPQDKPAPEWDDELQEAAG